MSLHLFRFCVSNSIPFLGSIPAHWCLLGMALSHVGTHTDVVEWLKAVRLHKARCGVFVYVWRPRLGPTVLLVPHPHVWSLRLNSTERMLCLCWKTQQAVIKCLRLSFLGSDSFAIWQRESKPLGYTKAEGGQDKEASQLGSTASSLSSSWRIHFTYTQSFPWRLNLEDCLVFKVERRRGRGKPPRLKYKTYTDIWHLTYSNILYLDSTHVTFSTWRRIMIISEVPASKVWKMTRLHFRSYG